MRRILLLDDDPAVLNALLRNFRQIVSREPLQMEVFADPYQALNRVAEKAFDLIISDFHMPDMNGVDFLVEVKRIQPSCIRMMLSGALDPATLLAVINQAEALRYIPKPWDLEDLQEAYNLACRRHDEMLEEHRLADERRLEKGKLTPQELALRRLEEEEPGITKVHWGVDGSVLFNATD